MVEEWLGTGSFHLVGNARLLPAKWAETNLPQPTHPVYSQEAQCLWKVVSPT